MGHAAGRENAAAHGLRLARLDEVEWIAQRSAKRATRGTDEHLCRERHRRAARSTAHGDERGERPLDGRKETEAQPVIDESTDDTSDDTGRRGPREDTTAQKRHQFAPKRRAAARSVRAAPLSTLWTPCGL